VQLVNPDIFLNNHHPVFHTVLLGGFVNLGATLGSQSVGLFLFVLLQTGLLAAGFAGMVSLQREFRTPLWARIVILAIACFVPLFPSWAVCVTKDTLFTAFILLYLVTLVRCMLNPSLLQRKTWLVTFILTSILVCITRNNGVFVVLFTAIALAIAYRKKPLRILAAVSGAVVVCFALYVSVLLPALGVSPGSVREALSLPTQQIAYVTTSDPEGITSDQRQAIARVYDYETMPLLYNPQNADLVKNGYNPSATTQDTLAFLGAWAQIGVTHPTGYAIAFCANTFAWVDPGVETSYVWLRTNCWGMTSDMGIDDRYRENGFNFDQNSSLENARNNLYAWFQAYVSSPFHLLTNEALSIWVLIFAVCLVLRRGVRAQAVGFVPVLTIFLVCLVSPINGLYRYALPYVAAMPFLLSFAYASVRQRIGAHEESTDKAAAMGDSCDNAVVDIQSEDA
jgi:energy-coupling factor transporter transmembrane protein EcfT